MVNALILTALAVQSPASLEFAEGGFVIKSGESEINVSLEEHNLPASFPAEKITLTIQGAHGGVWRAWAWNQDGQRHQFFAPFRRSQ